MMISEEDKQFWQQTIKDVKRQKSQVVNNEKKVSKPVLRQKHFYATMQDFSDYSKALNDGEFGGIDSSTLRKFKREEFKVEATLDLHGLNEAEAFDKVDNFIPQCYFCGKRCIIIITGKGLTVNKDDDVFKERGILKNRVPKWLNTPRLRAMILIYKHPTAKLGGSGALYILLRRNKDL